MMLLLILLSVGVTSMLSGVLGMGGGMLLMGILVSLLPIGSAMVLHGIAQFAANGSRAVLHGKHLQWRILPLYAIGAGLAFAGFRALTFLPETWQVYLIMGCLPFFAVYGKRFMVLDIERRSHAVICGALVTILQLTCGVSGPALDIFYLHTKMSRHAIVSTKAFTQMLGHGLKLIYYQSFMEAQNADSIWVCLVALLGTLIGARFLEKTNDQNFQYWSRRVLLLIGIIYLGQGFYGLWQSI